METGASRLARFEKVLAALDTPTKSAVGLDKQLKRSQLKQLALQGIPDKPAPIRPSCYRHLLGLAPPSTLVSQYISFLEDISTRIDSLPDPNPAQGELKEDRLLREIERDVDRTFGALAWFGATIEIEPEEVSDAANPPTKRNFQSSFWKRLKILQQAEKSKAAELAQRQNGEESETTSLSLTRRQVLLRPLFVYATLNPGLSYVQGMNSLVAVLFYIFGSSQTTNSLQAEAEAFFGLGALLSQLQDLFLPGLDENSASGLSATFHRFTSLLNWLDPNVAASLEHKQIQPNLYAIRWWTTLFAHEFQLPDLVRIWDRLICLYPAPEEVQQVEALSPVLGHVIDISLSLLLLEKAVIISPYSSFQKIVAVLQDSQLEGEKIDELLETSWNIRRRRLGAVDMKQIKRTSWLPPETTSTNWRLSANKWAAAASAGTSRFWSNSIKTDSRAAEFDLEETNSVAESENSAAVSNVPEEILSVEGKILPPPPARTFDPPANSSLTALIEAELPEPIDSDEEDDANKTSLVNRATLGIKSSLSRLAASDTAAELSKRATNLRIGASLQADKAAHLADSDSFAALSKTRTNLSVQAQILREQVATEAPERLAAIRNTVTTASGRLLATGNSQQGPRDRYGPSELPFTPPRGMAGKFGLGRDETIRRPLGAAEAKLLFGTTTTTNEQQAQFSPQEMLRSTSGGSNSGSAGPKPLLLSSSARKAAGGNEMGGNSPDLNASQQIPIGARANSISPTTIRSNHQTEISTTTSAANFHNRSASSIYANAPNFVSDDIPISSRRIAGVSENGAATIRPNLNASTSSQRGWTLSDNPMPSSMPTSRPTLDSHLSENSLSRQSSASGGEDAADSFVDAPSGLGGDDDADQVNDDVRRMFSVLDRVNLPPRRSSSLANSTNQPELSLQTNQLSQSVRGTDSTRSSALDDVTALDSPLTPKSAQDLTRSKIVRRPGASKRKGNRASDLSERDRRSVSSFLAGESELSRGDSGSSGTREGKRLSRASLAANRRISGTGGWDEDEDFLGAYGEDSQDDRQQEVLQQKKCAVEPL